MKNIAQNPFLEFRRAPVMVLPQTTLFPQAMLPLRIFEPQYRQMLATCLEGDRMFCLALLKPGIQEARSLNDFYHFAGLGLVRACVACPDGTSNLVLQGVARVRFTHFLQECPFRIAEFQPVLSPPITAELASSLTQQILGLCMEMRHRGFPIPPAFDEQVAKVSDPDLVGDIVAHNFVRNPQHRQEILETIDVHQRLRTLIRHLRFEMTSSP